MKKYLPLVLCVFLTSGLFAQTPTDLFFSEYIEGSGNNKCVEIYNPTNQAINLSSYYVVRFSNGSSVFTEGGVTQLDDYNLEPYKTFVLVNGQTVSTPTSPACSPELQALANQLDHDYPAPTYMNGNDAIALIKTTDGQEPNADLSNVLPVDLIGQIGLGNLISAETGWSYVQDSTLTYNDSNGDPVTGKVINYIVQKTATDGTTYGPFWMSWTSDHSLIRKPTVISGVVANPSPFVVTMEWDTVAAQLDSTGYYSYKDIWDNLGSHDCVADPDYTSVNEIVASYNLNIYPNPINTESFNFSSNKEVKEIKLYDILGKEILNHEYSTPLKETLVFIGNQKTGIYIIKVTFTDNNTLARKVHIK